jgi:hypothetical protein
LNDDERAMARRFDTLVRPLDLDDVPLYGSGRARRVARRKQILKTTSTILAVILAAGGLFVVSQRSATSAVSLDEVIERFHTDTIEPDAKDAPKPGHGSEREAPEPAAAAVEKSAAADASDLAAVKDVADVLPAEGVYAYRTTGGEQVSLFGAHHDYPERTFATVRHLGGCRWEARNDVVAEHIDIRTLCNDEGSFLQLRQERRVTFFGKQDGAAMDCEPPLTLYTSGDATGTRTSTVCSDGEGSDVRLDSVLLGIEDIVIGGERVRAVHVRDDGTCTGRVNGTSMDELWLDFRTGMTLKWNRTVDTLATAFGGAKVRYTEEATFVLESLQPRG